MIAVGVNEPGDNFLGTLYFCLSTCCHISEQMGASVGYNLHVILISDKWQECVNF